MDIRFVVKTESGKFVTFMKPEIDNPDADCANMLRAAMQLNFEEGKPYRLNDVSDYLFHGQNRLVDCPEQFRKYETRRVTMHDAFYVLQGIIWCIVNLPRGIQFDDCVYIIF